MSNTIRTDVAFDFTSFIAVLRNLVQYSKQVDNDLAKAGQTFYRYIAESNEVLKSTVNQLVSEFGAKRNLAFKAVSGVFQERARKTLAILRELDREIYKLDRKIEKLRTVAGTSLKPEIFKPILSDYEAQLKKLKSLKDDFEIDLTFRDDSALRKAEERINNIRKSVESLDVKFNNVRNTINKLNTSVDQLGRTINSNLSRSAKLSDRIKFFSGKKEVAYFKRILNNISRYRDEIRKTYTEIKKARDAGKLSIEEYYAKEREIHKKLEILKKQEVAFERARFRELDRIRGTYLSKIARGLETHPFSAHELAKPAEILTTSFVMSPIKTMKDVWAQSRVIAAEEGKKTAAVFARSLGQYGRQQFTRAFGAWLGAAFTTFGIFYGVVNTIREINRQYNDLVEISRYVQSATYSVGRGFEDLSSIMDNVILLSIKTGKSFREVGSVLWELKSAGFGMREAIAGTEAALKLVSLAGGGVDPAKSARIVAGLYRLFKDQFKDIADESERFNTILGKVVYTLNISQIGFDELLKSFEYFGSTAKATGMTLEQMLAYLSVLSDERLPGVGRAARQAVNQISQAIPALASKYGIVLDVTKPLAEQLNDVFSVLNTKVEEGRVNLAEFSFWMQEAGIRGGPAIIALARNWEIVNKRLKDLQYGLETLGMSYDEFFKTISEKRMSYFVLQWGRLKNAAYGAFSKILHGYKNTLAIMFEKMADSIENIIEKWNRAGEEAIKVYDKIYRKRYGFSIKEEKDFTTDFLGLDYDLWSKKYSDAFGASIFNLFRSQSKIAKIQDDFTDDLIKNVTASIANKLSKAELPSDKVKAFWDNFYINKEELRRILESKGLLAAINYIRQEMYKAAKAAGLMAKNLEALKDSALDLKSSINTVKSIGEFFDSLVAAAYSGRRGLVQSFKKMSATFAGASGTLTQMVRLEAEINRLQKERNKYSDEEYKKRLDALTKQADALRKNDEVVSRFFTTFASFRRGMNETLADIYSMYKKTSDPFAKLYADLNKLAKIQKDVNAILTASDGTIDDLRKGLLDLADVYEKAGKKNIAEMFRDMARSAENLADALERLNWKEIDASIISKYVNDFVDTVENRAVRSIRSFSSALRVDLNIAASQAGVMLEALGISVDNIKDPYVEAIDHVSTLIEKLEDQGKATDEAYKALERLLDLQENYNKVLKEISKEGAEELSLDVVTFGAGKNVAEAQLARKLRNIEKQRKKLEEVGKKIYDANRAEFEKVFGSWEDFIRRLDEAQRNASEIVRKKWEETNDIIKSNYKSMLDDLKSYSEDVFFRFFKGEIRSLGDVFNGVMDIFRRTTARLLSDLLYNKLSGALGLSTGKSGTLDKAFSLASIGGFLKSSWGKISKFLKFLPWFGDGGYVTSPTLAVVGEKEPEIILPESKLRHLFNQSQSIHNTFVIYAVDSQSFEDYVRRNPNAIIGVVSDALTRNTELAKTVRAVI